MSILVAKEMINVILIHVIIMVIVLTCGKHLIVHVKDLILEILANTVRFNIFIIFFKYNINY